jgi:lipoprotein-releasing system permease protein
MSPWTPFEWITALRFLKEGRLQTLFIVAAVAIGVAVIVFMSAMLSSLQANFIKRVLTSQPHIQLIPPDEVARPLRPLVQGQIVASIVQRPAQRIRSIDQWQKIREQLSTWPEIVTVAPTVSGSALAVRGAASRSIALNGVDPEAYFKIVHIEDYIVAGQPRVSTDDILVGTELSKNLGASLGDKITITGATTASRVLTITGIFDLGNKGANQRTTYVALRTAQALNHLVGGVTTIDMTVNDIYAAETIAQNVQAATGVEADSWIQTNAQFFTAVNAQANSNTLIRVFVALSVAFGIASVLVVSVI